MQNVYHCALLSIPIKGYAVIECLSVQRILSSRICSLKLLCMYLAVTLCALVCVKSAKQSLGAERQGEVGREQMLTAYYDT